MSPDARYETLVGSREDNGCWASKSVWANDQVSVQQELGCRGTETVTGQCTGEER